MGGFNVKGYRELSYGEWVEEMQLGSVSANNKEWNRNMPVKSTDRGRRALVMDEALWLAHPGHVSKGQGHCESVTVLWFQSKFWWETRYCP